jgi:hypothetical protein
MESIVAKRVVLTSINEIGSPLPSSVPSLIEFDTPEEPNVGKTEENSRNSLLIKTNLDEKLDPAKMSLEEKQKIIEEGKKKKKSKREKKNFSQEIYWKISCKFLKPN